MKLHIYGDIQTVLRGSVEDSLLKEISLTDFAYGLGAGEIAREAQPRFGEALVWEHKAYLGTKDQVYKEHCMHLLAHPLISMGIFYVESFEY